MSLKQAEQADFRITEYLKHAIDETGKSLYDHLCDIYYEIQHEPKNIYTECRKVQFFEKLSSFLKRHNFKYSANKTSEQVNNFIDKVFPWQDYVQNLTQLFQSKSQSLETIFPNFHYQNQLLQTAGIGFSEEEAYQIQQSLKKLVESQPPKYFYSLRFWGKILTNGQDYFIAEAVLRKYYQEDLPADSEQPGTGINELVHYVTNDIYDEWNLLPSLTRKQMELSRLIKYAFTGDLDRKLSTYPPFQGREKHFLKAQIVRISHATLIAPRGLYKVNEETKALEFEDEFKLPELTELSTAESWVHVNPAILRLGRVSYWVDPSLNEEAKQAVLDQLTAEDPEGERLKGISEDKNANSYYQPGPEPAESGWFLKQYGDPQQYTTDDQTVNYSSFSLKNTLWPGAATVFNKNQWVTIYIGYGQKNLQAPFVPVAPNDLQEEPEDNDEYPEPNPQTLADELEPDSDDERRRLQEQLDAQQDQ